MTEDSSRSTPGFLLRRLARQPSAIWSCCSRYQLLALASRAHGSGGGGRLGRARAHLSLRGQRSEQHTSEIQSQSNLACRLLLEKKKKLRNRLRMITLLRIFPT